MHHENAVEGRKRGGKQKANMARVYSNAPDDLKDIWKRAREALVATHEGTLPPKVGASMASQISALVKLYELGLLHQQLADMDEKMILIERQLQGDHYE